MDRTNPTLVCTYADLRRVHEADLTTEGRSSQQVKNQLSSLNAFMRFLGRADSVCLIEDFNEDFDSRLNSYAQNAIIQGLSKVTVENRLSHLRALLVTARKVINASVVRETFTETVQGLLEANSMSTATLARRCGLNSNVIEKWMSGKATPRIKSRQYIEKIEDAFGLTRNTLVRMTSGYEPGYDNSAETVTSKRRKEYHQLTRDTYAYREPCAAVEQEWKDFVYFNTAPFLINGMKRNTSWRVKPEQSVDRRYLRGFGARTQGGVCVTAGMLWGTISRFFGYLLQNGFTEDQLSLALLTDSQRVAPFLEFKRQRSGVYAGEQKLFLVVCTTAMRPETGYLWQKPDFGGKLRTPVSPDNWREWCQKNRTAYIDILRELKRGNHFKKGRNPFDPIANIVGKPHPIQPLFDMIAKMQRSIPSLTQPSINAMRGRDLLLIKMLISNPLRVHNFAMMTWREDNTGNLYKGEDGEWRLRFDASDFKNQKGAASAEYDVTLSAWIYPELTDYLEKHRQLLYGADTSDRLFLPRWCGRPNHLQDSGGWSGESIGVRILTLTKKFIPDCPGFGPHAFRHIIATEYIKNNPNGFQVAANILHDRLTTVLRAYAHLKVSDGFSYWTAYLDNQIRTHRTGEANDE